MSRAFAICVGCLAVILAAVLAEETSSSAGVTMLPVVPTPVATAASEAGRASMPVSRDLAAALLARPLFEPNRRPPAAAVAPATLVAAAVPRVTGVLIGPRDRSAIFAAGADGARQIVAREGTQVGAFTVQSIRIGQVTVVGPDGPVTLHPSFDPNQRVERPPTPEPTPLTNIPGLPVQPAGPVGRFGLPSLPGLPARPATPNPSR